MKVLLDSRVWGGALADLEARGLDTDWAGAWQRDPGDDEILARAFAEQRVLVTLDKDFGELVVLRGREHCGIVRLANIRARDQARICLHVVNKYEQELSAGAILTVPYERVRIRAAMKSR
jgi:predicted nuclease of predicted toxin-antitoxin system